MEEPHENCVEGSEQIAQSLHRCNSMRSQILCQCRDVMTGSHDTSHDRKYRSPDMNSQSDGRNDTELTELLECDVLGELCILKMNGKVISSDILHYSVAIMVRNQLK